MPKPVNHGQPYSDDELRFVFQLGPTMDAKRQAAAILQRTLGSIKNCWTNANPTERPQALIEQYDHDENKHVLRIRRVYLEHLREIYTEAHAVLSLAQETLSGLASAEVAFTQARQDLLKAQKEVDRTNPRAWGISPPATRARSLSGQPNVSMFNQATP